MTNAPHSRIHCLRMKNMPSKGIPSKEIGDVVSCLLAVPHVRRATCYVATNFTVKATRQRKADGRNRSATMLVTVGAPNFVERRFIRLATEAGELFPVKKIQLKFWPNKP